MKIILITCTSHRQHFNVVACFLLGLFGHRLLLLYLILYFCVALSTSIKMEQTIEKSPNFQQILLKTLHKLQSNLPWRSFICSRVVRLCFFIYAIFICYFSEINKNGTNNWQITKLSANAFQHSDELQSKFECCSFIRSWDIRLCFLYQSAKRHP